MKRMITSNRNLNNKYLVSEVSSCPFPGMIAFNIIDNERKEDLINRSEKMIPEYVYPHGQLLSLSQGDANSIIEELEEHYDKDIHPSRVRDVLLNDQYSGVIAKLDGTLVMIAGHFDRYPVDK